MSTQTRFSFENASFFLGLGLLSTLKESFLKTLSKVDKCCVHCENVDFRKQRHIFMLHSHVSQKASLKQDGTWCTSVVFKRFYNFCPIWLFGCCWRFWIFPTSNLEINVGIIILYCQTSHLTQGRLINCDLRKLNTLN